MLIYTSNYARNGKNPLAVAISVSVPQWYNGKRLSQLSPSWDIVSAYKNKSISEDEYAVEYFNLLKTRQLDPIEIISIIPDKSILLCYEPPNQFCHRHLVAQWLSEGSDCVVEEWRTKKEIQDDKQKKLNDFLFDV